MATEEVHTKTMPFVEMDLSKLTQRALKKAGYVTASPVQTGFIPKALEEVDLVGQARTGTGKTAAFVIPILEYLAPRSEIPGVQALVLVPTRELAVQVCDEAIKLSHGRKVSCVAVYGGKPIKGQIRELERGAEIVVGTPGRVIDMLNRGVLKLNDLECVVLDEADRMLDIGFRPDIEKILRRCPKERQTLLLSATMPPPIERLAKKYMVDPEILRFSSGETVDTIEQHYFTVHPTNKFELLVRLLEQEQPKQAIVFCRTKKGTDRIFRKLDKKFGSVASMHGDMAQSQRDRVMKTFRAEKVKILVATDVVGRGIDVSSVSHIINFDIPSFCDDYVHRVGRTGRMGKEGVAYTFVCPDEGEELTKIEMRINTLLKEEEMEGFDLLTPQNNGEDRSKPTIDPADPPPPPPPGRRPAKRYKRGL